MELGTALVVQRADFSGSIVHSPMRNLFMSSTGYYLCRNKPTPNQLMTADVMPTKNDPRSTH